MTLTAERLTDARCAQLLAEWREQRVGQLAHRYPTLSHTAREDLYADAVEHILKRMKQGHSFNDEAHLKAMLERALGWQALERLRAPSGDVLRLEISEHALISDADAPDAIDNRLPAGLAADFLLSLSDREQKVFKLRVSGSSRKSTARALSLTEAQVQMAYRHAKTRMDRIVALYDAGRWCEQRSADIGAREAGQADRVTRLRARAHFVHCVTCRMHAAEHRSAMPAAAAAMLPFPVILGASGGLFTRILSFFGVRAPTFVPGASGGGTGEKLAPFLAGGGVGALKIGAGVAVSALTIGAGALGIHKATEPAPNPSTHTVAGTQHRATQASLVSPLITSRSLYRASAIAQRSLYQATHVPAPAPSRHRRSHVSQVALEFGGASPRHKLHLTEFGGSAASSSASPSNTSSSSRAVTRRFAAQPASSAYPSSSFEVGHGSSPRSSASSEFGPP